jgi:hypothetical protein
VKRVAGGGGVRQNGARFFDALWFEVPACEIELEDADETFFGFIALFCAVDEMKVILVVVLESGGWHEERSGWSVNGCGCSAGVCADDKLTQRQGRDGT